MPGIRYRTIAKVLCQNCAHLVRTRQPIDPKCPNCSYLKFNNIRNLLSFTELLHREHPDWVYFNVYEYKKGEEGRFLNNFIKGKKEPSGKTL